MHIFTHGQTAFQKINLLTSFFFFLNFHFIDLLLKSKHHPTSAPSTATHDNLPQGPEPCQFHFYSSSWKASQDGISAVSQGCWSQRKVWDAQMPPGDASASQTTSWFSCNQKPGAFTQTGITEIGGGGRMAEMKKDFYQELQVSDLAQDSQEKKIRDTQTLSRMKCGNAWSWGWVMLALQNWKNLSWGFCFPRNYLQIWGHFVGQNDRKAIMDGRGKWEVICDMQVSSI